MIQGQFGADGELIFEIELITGDGDLIPVDVLLDTGFTTGYLAIHLQDIVGLGWQKLSPERVKLKTAQGQAYFELYEGRVIVDGKEFIAPVHCGEELPEILFGQRWLDFMKLVVNKPEGILSLEYIGS